MNKGTWQGKLASVNEALFVPISLCMILLTNANKQHLPTGASDSTRHISNKAQIIQSTLENNYVAYVIKQIEK